MNLREPKKKKRVKLKLQAPFPITVGDGNEWVTYTAHLTDVGSCIIEPNEITAIHSMGFFGKGSLSRAYPSFGKARYGAPPIVRNRQWLRRQEWLKQFNELSKESNSNKDMKFEDDKEEESASNLQEFSENNEKLLEEQERETTPDIIEVHRNLVSGKESDVIETSNEDDMEIDQIILDPTEDDDVCVIISKDNKKHYDKEKKCDKHHTSDDENKAEFYSFESQDFKEGNTCFMNSNSGLQDKLLVLPDSDSEAEDYLKNIEPKIECESFPVQETLHLTFEETFFLLYGLGCLSLINFDGTLLDINSAWLYFCKVDKNFVQKYVVYHYFRSKGWVVKPGLKYGGDFLLYKQGPPFYHASYIVLIDVVDADSLIRSPSRSMRNLTWNNLLGLERLSETAAKEILFAQVLWPSSISQTPRTLNPEVLSEFTVKEVLWRRWNPKHGKDVIDLEAEDDDSC